MEYVRLRSANFSFRTSTNLGLKQQHKHTHSVNSMHDPHHRYERDLCVVAQAGQQGERLLTAHRQGLL